VTSRHNKAHSDQDAAEPKAAAEGMQHAAGQGADAGEHPAEEDLRAQVEKIEQEKQELNDRLLRTLAEFENFKKRVAKEKAGLVAYGSEKLALELLPVVDNFERAFEQARTAVDVQPVVEGIAMILKQIEEALKKFHIRPFNAIGERFDPEKHEAMAQQEHLDIEEHTVVQEFQKGYMINEKLLRPARVIVSTRPPQQDPSSDEPAPDEPRSGTA